MTSPQTGNNSGNKTGIVKGFTGLMSGNTTTVKKPESLSADITFTLPNNDEGQNYFLRMKRKFKLITEPGQMGATTDALTDAKSGGANFGNSIIMGHQSGSFK